MADLLVRDELRLAMPATPFTAGTLEAARRLQRGLFWGQVTHRLRRIAAVAVFVGVGWFAHAELGVLGVQETAASTPAFVEDARHSHRTALLRARMHSQPPATDYDPAENHAATPLETPPLPARLRGAAAH